MFPLFVFVENLVVNENPWGRDLENGPKKPQRPGWLLLGTSNLALSNRWFGQKNCALNGKCLGPTPSHLPPKSRECNYTLYNYESFVTSVRLVEEILVTGVLLRLLV